MHRHGVTWQIVPSALGEMSGDEDPEKAIRGMQAMLQMDKIDQGLKASLCPEVVRMWARWRQSVRVTDNHRM
jgi:hypothetical protein